MKRINAQYLEYLEKILKDPCGSKLFQKVLVMLTVYPMFIQTIRLSVFIIGLVSLIPCLMKKYPVAHFEKLYHHFLSQIFLHHACLYTRISEKKTLDMEKLQTDFFNSIDKIPCFDDLKSSKKLYEITNVFIKCHDQNKISILIFDFSAELPKYLGHIQTSSKVWNTE